MTSICRLRTPSSLVTVRRLDSDNRQQRCPARRSGGSPSRSGERGELRSFEPIAEKVACSAVQLLLALCVQLTVLAVDGQLLLPHVRSLDRAYVVLQRVEPRLGGDERHHCGAGRRRRRVSFWGDSQCALLASCPRENLTSCAVSSTRDRGVAAW